MGGTGRGIKGKVLSQREIGGGTASNGLHSPTSEVGEVEHSFHEESSEQSTLLDKGGDIEGDMNSGRANKAWAQACIRFVNRNGQEITEADIQERDQPKGVDLDSDSDNDGQPDGLDEFHTITDASGNIRIVETDEERALISGLKDNDDLTLDIIFVNRLSRGSRGESFPDSVTLAPEADPNHKRTIIIALNRSPFTTPHEIGHVLLNSGHHFESNDPNEEYRNLMRSGTSDTDAVNESKRLTPDQVNTARASPLAQ